MNGLGIRRRCLPELKPMTDIICYKGGKALLIQSSEYK